MCRPRRLGTPWQARAPCFRYGNSGPGALSRILIAIFAVGLILFAASHLRPAIKAWSGRGTKGYFVAQNQLCGGRFHACHWAGEFESSRNVVVMQDVTWNGADPGLTSGSVVPALAEAGDTDHVYPPHSTYALLRLIGLILFGTVLLYVAGRPRSPVARLLARDQ